MLQPNFDIQSISNSSNNDNKNYNKSASDDHNNNDNNNNDEHNNSSVLALLIFNSDSNSDNSAIQIPFNIYHVSESFYCAYFSDNLLKKGFQNLES